MISFARRSRSDRLSPTAAMSLAWIFGCFREIDKTFLALKTSATTGVVDITSGPHRMGEGSTCSFRDLKRASRGPVRFGRSRLCAAKVACETGFHRISEQFGVAAEGLWFGGQDVLRRLQSAGQRRFDRAHIGAGIKCLAGKE
jgi:hypothetical protein